ncbi:MAG TPA: hypothetical protein VIY28_14145 [Pseudonocardiaceae bacterium]
MPVDDGSSSPARAVMLWVHVEHAHQRWHTWDRPDWTRFGITVTTDEQRVWLGEPSNAIIQAA